ncbi:MAG TPA: zf-HC2 domain-containing protein [Actinomycetes bacterium]|nr:zf-HC2 domain-containing protein [Actinomycetes bacterium]
MTNHLGERINALVDGELDHTERDRLLGHVADCLLCRSELDVLRKIKARLARSTGPEMSSILLNKLLAMAEPGGPVPPARRPLAGPSYPIAPPPRSAATDASGRPVATHPGSTGPGRPRRRGGRRRYVYLTGASALSVGLIALGTAFAAGDATRGGGPLVTPPVGDFVVQHAQTSNSVPFTDPASTVIFGGGYEQSGFEFGTVGSTVGIWGR